MSPAALSASPPSLFESRVLGVREEGAEAKTFRLSVPPGFSFVPGMWVMVHFPDSPKLSRAYSICSSPFAKGHVEFSLNNVGALTHRLCSLKEGETLMVKGPYGKWVYRDEARQAVLISGGTGLTPFRSMCRYVLEKNLPNKLTILYSARTPAAILYKTDLEEFARAGIKVYTTITRPNLMKAGERWDGPTGRIGIEVIERQADDFHGSHYYMCGPISLIENLTSGLLARGIPREHIHYEKWGAYQDL